MVNSGSSCIISQQPQVVKQGGRRCPTGTLCASGAVRTVHRAQVAQRLLQPVALLERVQVGDCGPKQGKVWVGVLQSPQFCLSAHSACHTVHIIAYNGRGGHSP